MIPDNRKTIFFKVNNQEYELIRQSPDVSCDIINSEYYFDYYLYSGESQLGKFIESCDKDAKNTCKKIILNLNKDY